MLAFVKLVFGPHGGGCHRSRQPRPAALLALLAQTAILEDVIALCLTRTPREQLDCLERRAVRYIVMTLKDIERVRDDVVLMTYEVTT